MNKSPVCQSCEMPMDAPDKFGKNADGGQCEDYCCHCWQNGKFTYESTLEEAIESNIPFLVKYGVVKTEQEARAMLQESMPKLKRWA